MQQVIDCPNLVLFVESSYFFPMIPFVTIRR